MDSNQSSSSSSSFHIHHTKRRKFHNVKDAEDDIFCSSRTTSDDSKKHNHSEIEKRRRDKMNTFITELSAVIPGSVVSKKLDKLTVLRMAVQHLKTLRGDDWTLCRKTGQYKPSYIQDHELKNLILRSAEGFLFVVSCDRGRLLYVSESVLQVLNFSQADLVGQSWFDILHSKEDVAKVKEQLFSCGLSARERVVDAKTMLHVKETHRLPQMTNCLCPGARRSFFCKMKCKLGQPVKEEVGGKKDLSQDKKFRIMYCTGYLKWVKVGVEEGEGSDNWSCSLIGIAKVLPPVIQSPLFKDKAFISRYTADCKFIFADQRVTVVLGFLPQELLGTSMYEYIHNDDRAMLTQLHKSALASNSETSPSQVFRFKNGNASYVKLQATWKSFRNPWTKEIEYLIARNFVVDSSEDQDIFVGDGQFNRMTRQCSKDDDASDTCPTSNDCFSPPDIDFFTSRGAANDGNQDLQNLVGIRMKACKRSGTLTDDEITNSSHADSPSNKQIEQIIQTTGSSADTPRFPSDCVQDVVTSDNSSESSINQGEEKMEKHLSIFGLNSVPRQESASHKLTNEQRNPSQIENFIDNDRLCLLNSSTTNTDEMDVLLNLGLLQPPVHVSGSHWQLPPSP